MGAPSRLGGRAQQRSVGRLRAVVECTALDLLVPASDAQRVSTDDRLWESDYPHRDDPADIGRLMREEPVDVTRVQIAAAFQVERRARAFMGGRQMTGVQTSKRHVLVDDDYVARTLLRAFQVAAPSEEAQKWMDRALGCLRQCFARGMVVLMWDRPGYDDVTPAFQALLAFASDPTHTPLELAWEPTYLGDRPPVPHNYKPPKPLDLRKVYAIIMVFGVFLFTFLWWFVRRQR